MPNLVIANNPHLLFPVGGGGATFDISLPGTISDLQDNPADASAGLKFERPGTYAQYSSGWSGNAYWIDPASADVGDDYEVRLTVNSGSSPTSGTAGSWLALSATRQWFLSRTTLGTSTGNWTVEIRDVATQTIQASDTFTISATKQFGG